MGDEIEHPLTFAEAEKVNAYELARRWGDPTRLPVRVPVKEAEARGFRVRATEHELEELATMSALRAWLDRWTAVQIHRALQDGATVDQVAAAVGTTPAEVAATWREWDAGQRHLWQTYPDMAKTTEHDQVAALLDQSAPEELFDYGAAQAEAIRRMNWTNNGLPVGQPREVEEVLAKVRAYGNRCTEVVDARRDGREADAERLENEADQIHDQIKTMLVTTGGDTQ